ncbi:MAG: hypothetical protein HQK51_02135 [Oligoflexia bacterium]|nr:hypothetical protein [Oligoflexia bacterium]
MKNIFKSNITNSTKMIISIAALLANLSVNVIASSETATTASSARRATVVSSSASSDKEVVNAFLFDVKNPITSSSSSSSSRDKANPFLNLINLFTNATFTGLVLNSERNGSGATSEAEPPYMAAKKLDEKDKIFASTRCEGPVFQMLRVLSYADAEFIRRMLEDKKFEGLPSSAWVMAAPLSNECIDKLPESSLLDENMKNFISDITKKANDPKFALLAPEMLPMKIKNVDSKNFCRIPSTVGSAGIKQNKELYQQVRKGIRDYLGELRTVLSEDKTVSTAITPTTATASTATSVSTAKELDTKKIKQQKERLAKMLKAFKL